MPSHFFDHPLPTADDANFLAELDQRGGVAGQAVLKKGRAGEILPGGSFTPPLHHRLIALVEGVLRIQQRNQNGKRNSGVPQNEDLSGSDYPT